jgi:hypothetical protein
MSTNQSGEKEGRQYVTTQAYKAIKEELLGSKKMNLDIMDDCPLCAKRGVTLEVGNHRSDQPTGNKNNGVDALNLFLYTPHLISPSRLTI